MKTNTPFREQEQNTDQTSNTTEAPQAIPLTTPLAVPPAMPLPVPAATASTSTEVNCLSGMKEYFLKRIMPQDRAEEKKRRRISTMKYGEALTSEQALERLNTSEEKRKQQQQTNKQQVRRETTEADNNKKDESQNVDLEMTIERDTYYAVLFTKPAKYYIARVLNESTPPEGETTYVMKFLDRGPNNTHHLPSREKVEDVEKKFILCKANLVGAGPFYLSNYTEVENVYKQKLQMMKSAR